MTLDRFGNFSFDPVPLDALRLKWPKLQASQAEVGHLIGAHAGAVQAVATLEAQRPAARDRDLDDAATAIRAGKEAPAPRAEPALERKLESAARTRDAFSRAVSNALEELENFKRANAVALEADAARSLEALRTKLAESAAKTGALYAESEAAGASVKKLAPPAVAPPESTAAGQDSVYAPQFVAQTSRAAGPSRGEIERVLLYLGGGA
jgi:DNA polymerase III alpha subunit